jgi:NDP-sugar pyrophosphorylase family protein
MPNAVDAILLCGGAGLRLRSVSGDAPKTLTKIGDRPFLELLLSQLRRHGFERAILAVGYRSDAIRAHLGDRALGLNLEYSTESRPLGTGGALRNALDFIHSDTALILNGDSYTAADLSAFANDYRSAKADFSMVVVPADGRSDVGLVAVDPGGKILAFKEKQISVGMGHVNAGIYMTAKRILGDIPAGTQVSLEEELFPRWLAEGKYLRAFRYPGECVDIGTPERYRSAQESLANAEAGGTRSSPESQRT